MIYLIIYIVLSVGFFIYLCKTAPLGYEDETGFHFGEKKE